MSSYHVLIVEDDETLRRTVFEAFKDTNYLVREAKDGLEALEMLKVQKADLVLMDVNMPRLGGLDCLKQVKEFDPATIVILMTAYSNIEDAVRAIKEGAYNYLAKPIKHSDIVEMVSRALEAKQMVQRMALSAPVIRMDSGEFVGNSNEMKKVFNIIHKLAKVDTSVLIRGESGTGKELVARAIHFNSSRKDNRLVAINCNSIAETLFESELFGHEKGSFTGADQRKIGKFQYAEGGTIFLDEIGDLSPAMQVKLLRVLQERKFTPVGSNREIDMDVRIIAATNRNLEELIQKGQFREDLFYRLNVIPIFLPPLRNRKEDISNLVKYFLNKFNRIHHSNSGTMMQGVSAQVMEVFMGYSWPGNIRELENVMEHAFVIEAENQISLESIPMQLRSLRSAALSSDASVSPYSGTEADTAVDEDTDDELEDLSISGQSGGELDYRIHKEQFEKEFIIKALKTFKGRINQTALHAKIPKKTLLRKLQKYAIRAEDYHSV